MFKLKTLKMIKMMAKSLKNERDQRARLIQKYLKGVKATIKVRKMRLRKLKNEKATLLQSYMKGYLGVKQIRKQRIQIGAAIMIQSLYRGYATRKLYLEYLRILSKARDRKHRKFNGKSQAHNRPDSRQYKNIKQAQKYV